MKRDATVDELRAALERWPELQQAIAEIKAAERRATVERIREAVRKVADDPALDGVMGLGFDAIYAILDEEAAR